MVEFTVAGDGCLKDIKVVQSLGADCDEEAIRVVKLHSKKLGWKPGKQQGKPVDVKFAVPVKFGES